MYANWLAVLTVSLAALTWADTTDLPGSSQQRQNFVQHMEQLKNSYKDSPEATALAREIEPYITAANYAQATALVRQFQAANIPQDASQFSSWASNPLVFATDGPQPDFVRNMPAHVRDKYLNAQYDQLKAAASLARKDFQMGAAASILPSPGWVVGAAAGVAGVAALFL